MLAMNAELLIFSWLGLRHTFAAISTKGIQFYEWEETVVVGGFKNSLNDI